MRTFTLRLLVLHVLLLIVVVTPNIARTSEFDKLLSLPEDKIDIGTIALTLAKEFYPNLDVAAYSRKIDMLVKEAQWLAQGTQDPERRIRALNTMLFCQEGFHYDHSSDARRKQEYYFLNGILDSKQGICYSMPLLYLVVAQRLGYPIYPVDVPDHLFVRYVQTGFPFQNIEVTSGGKYFPDEKYIRYFTISTLGLKSGSYLRTLSYHEFLGNLVAANGFFYTWHGNITKAIEYFELAARFNPRSADHYNNLASSYQMISNSQTGEAAARSRSKAAHYAEKAKALGFVSDEDIARKRR